MADDSLFGGSGVGLLIILFFIMGGFGGNGFGWGGNGGVATSNEVQRGFDNQNSMANQREILAAVSCCNTLRAIDNVKYENSQNTNKILEALAQNKIEALQGKVAELQLAQATSNVVRYPNAWTWNAGPSPFCGGCGA